MPIAYKYDGPRTSVSITRRFSVSPECVFDAWIEYETASKWLFPAITSKTECKLDARVGGSYTITRSSGGNQYKSVGKYLEINRPHRLVFTFGMPKFDADFDTIIVEIKQERDGSVLNLTQKGLLPAYETSILNGWGKMFDLLAKVLK